MVTMVLVIIFVTIFFWGGVIQIFAPRQPLIMQTTHVIGLRNGAPVWVLGVEVGRVERIELHNSSVMVEMSLLQKHLPFIHQDAVGQIVTMGLLGDKYVSIEPGSAKSPPIKSGSVIRGATVAEVDQIMEVTLMAIKNVESFMARLENLLGTLQAGKGTLGLLLNDSTLYGALAQTATNLGTLSDSLVAGQGTLGQLISNEALYQMLYSSATEMRNLTRMAMDSSGTMGKLLQDGSLYQSLGATAQGLREIVQGIDEGRGVAGTLVSDDSLAQSVRSTLFRVNTLIDEIAKNPKQYFKLEIF
jgi:phospholipid/cholesterol/gamma-HCH transport system substrate-binding protein